MEINCNIRIPLFHVIKLQNGFNKTKLYFDHGAWGQILTLVTVILMFQEEPQVDQGVHTTSALANQAAPGSGLLLSSGASYLLWLVVRGVLALG